MPFYLYKELSPSTFLLGVLVYTEVLRAWPCFLHRAVKATKPAASP